MPERKYNVPYYLKLTSVEILKALQNRFEIELDTSVNDESIGELFESLICEIETMQIIRLQPASEVQARVPIDKMNQAVEVLKGLGFNVGTDADYSDPDNYVKVIIRE